MDQISPPVRIVAVVALLFAALWFTMLRPEDATTAPPAAAATPSPTPAGAAADPDGPKAATGLGRAAQAARGAAKTQAASDARSSGTAPAAAKLTTPAAAEPTTPAAAKPTTPAAAEDATKPVPRAARPAAARPAAAVAKATGLPAPAARAIAARHVLVLVVWNPRAAEDRVVRAAVRRVRRHGGKVRVQAVPVSRVSRYARVTKGVDVDQAPSVVVVDRRLHAQLLPGFYDRPSIDQAVADALRPG